MTPPKPCPFCGCQPLVSPTHPELDGNAWGRVECISASCYARPIVLDGELDADDRGSDLYKESAIRRWNTRPTEPGK
jgi:hypothetical protein